MTQPRLPDRAELQAAALACARRGWPVLPLQVGGTAPAVRRWSRAATCEPDRIRGAWAAGRFNVGIALAAAGLVVLELEGPPADGRRPPRWSQPGIFDGADVLAVLAEDHAALLGLILDTFATTTPDGRLHYYFRRPATQPARTVRLAWQVTLRGDDVLPAAGSATARGRFTAMHAADAAPLPAWLAELTATAPTPR